MTGPTKPTGIQAPRGTPDAESIVHQQFDAAGAGVGEQIAVVRLRGAEDLHHAGEQALGAGAHVQRLHGQPQGVDADHRSHAKSQVPQAAASCAGQFTTTLAAPRRNSSRMAGKACGGSSCSGTNAPPH